MKGVSADDSKRFTKEVSCLSVCVLRSVACPDHIVFQPSIQVEATTEKNVDKVSQLLIAKEKEVNSA